jgi:allophanate hydrolase subunit 2
MLAGERPQMHEDGQNFGLRMQWLQQKMQDPGAQMRLAQAPDSKAIVEERMQHLQFMQEQFTVNAQAGRVGVKQGG